MKHKDEYLIIHNKCCYSCDCYHLRAPAPQDATATAGTPAGFRDVLSAGSDEALV